MIWPTLLPVAQCGSGYPLVSSKLAKMLGFKGIYPLPLALPLDQNENWDSPYSHVKRAKLRGGVRGRGKTEKWNSP